MVPEQINHYKILEKLGEGGMGEVYRAEDTRLGRIVAIKLVLPHFASDQIRLKRFVHEAKAASALNHPNVCIIYDAGETNDKRPFIVMEYIEGLDLHERMEQCALTDDLIINLGIQLSDALSEAHAKGIIHRDIKPSNIRINQRDQANFLISGWPSSCHLPAISRPRHLLLLKRRRDS
ncbi:serine/threonine protein kinase [Acidobacteriota bacterium]